MGIRSSLLTMEKIKDSIENRHARGTIEDIAILQSAKDLLVGSGMLSKTEAEKVVSRERCCKIDSDGSTRRFWRLRLNDSSFCLIAAPAGRGRDELAESRSAWNIGNHLRKKGCQFLNCTVGTEIPEYCFLRIWVIIRLHDIVAKRKEHAAASAPRQQLLPIISAGLGASRDHAVPGGRRF